MEFYGGADEPRGSGKNPFQFPTGWNSTISVRISSSSSLVSIPNGMEFYGR